MATKTMARVMGLGLLLSARLALGQTDGTATQCQWEGIGWQRSFVCRTVGDAPRPGHPPDESELADLAQRLGAALDCSARSRDPLRAFCPAASAPRPFYPPRGSALFFGVSTLVLESGDLRASLAREATLRILHFDQWGVRVGTVEPRDPATLAGTGALVQGLVGALAGNGGGPLAVPRGLLEAEERPDAPAKPRRSNLQGVDFDTAVPARLVAVGGPQGGQAYLVVEREARGLRITLFPLVAFVDPPATAAR